MNQAGKRAISPGWMLIFSAALIVFSCSGRVNNPRQAVDRIIKAYGGEEKVDELQHYVGRGFIRDLTSKNVARSHPFDIFRNGQKLKTKTMMVRDGQLVNIQIVVYDGEEGYRFLYSTGKVDRLPGTELELQKYRFPLVLKWLLNRGESGKITGDESGEPGEVILSYRDGEYLVKIRADRKKWLLRNVEVRNQSDSNFVYQEDYGDYRKVKGVWFPNRFTAWMSGERYFEYLIPVIRYGEEFPDSLFSVLVSDTSKVGKKEKVKKTVQFR